MSRPHGARAGAASFIALVHQLHAEAEKQLEAHDLDNYETDVRDYVALSKMVETSIEANVVNGNPAVREGWLRALTDLLCTDGDGCAVGDYDKWDPIKTTEAAFAASRPARH